MTSFAAQFVAGHVLLDSRDHIGPHHLAIGKTRKLFEHQGIIEAFFSTGYGITHARLDGETLAPRGSMDLGLPVAWGGGAFCVDNDAAGRVVLVFLHRNRHELCLARGQCGADGIAWQPWIAVTETSGPQAAPWVELGPDGTAWASTLSRDGAFRLAVIAPDGTPASAPLFAPGETPWYHSCVQVEPFAKDRAVAIGFRGEFPARTELVFKTVTRGLETGPALTLAPCNVNDQLTFHFQAVGDAARGRAHIAYLDDGLAISHALYDGKDWHVVKGVTDFAAYAPQLCLAPDGSLALLVCDYEGAIWTASWSDAGWTAPRRLPGLPPSTISGLFGRTGYGTGGLISAARSEGGRVPFLYGVITDDRTAHADLHAASLGRRSGLLFERANPLSLAAEGGILKGVLRLESLAPADLARRRWHVVIPRRSGPPLKAVVAGEAANATFAHPTAQGDAALAFTIPAAPDLVPEKAWAESYDGNTLVDMAPFTPEAAAQTAMAPSRIPAIYKRIL
jgi:hypothetical protein